MITDANGIARIISPRRAPNSKLNRAALWRITGSHSLHEITVEQVRRFADTARLPASPLWEIVCEMVERTADAWQSLEQRDLLPSGMRKAIEKQIHGVISKTCDR